MNSPAHSSRAQQIEIERKLLVALCQAALDPDARITVVHDLGLHRFAEPDHEVVYRALAAMFSVNRSITLEALTQAVTRMGFPDMELRGLFTPSSPTPEEIASLLALL